MNKQLREMVKVDMVVSNFAIAAAAAAPAVSNLIPMGEHDRVLVHFTISSANLENDAVIRFGVVDDTVTAVTATGHLAARDGTDDTIRYEVLDDLAERCTALDVTPTYAAGTITINGTVFTHDATPDTDAREFNDLTTLVTAINTADIGITADESATELELDVTVPGSMIIDFTTTIGGITNDDYAIRQVDVQMEVKGSELNEDATGIYAVADYTAGTGAAVGNAVAIRSCKYTPAQTVAAEL